MANEDLKNQLEKLRWEQANAEEREKIAKEVNKLKAQKWSREHPRLARFMNMFRGAHF